MGAVWGVKSVAKSLSIFHPSAGERKSSDHPLVQRILGLTGLIVPRKPVFPKTRISWARISF
jgi:hypothetical protein